MKLAAETLAAKHSMSLEEALSQLRAQDPLASYDTSWDSGFEDIRPLYGSDYAIQYTPKDAEAEERVRADLSKQIEIPFRLEFRVTKFGQQELNAAAARIAERVPETNRYSSDFDIPNGTIVFFSPGDQPPSMEREVANAAAPASVRWENTDQRATDFVGGGGTFFGPPACTGNFVVEVNGGSNTGIAGAGHCALSTYFYSSPNGDPIGRQAGVNSGPADVAWYDSQFITWSPSFYIGTSPNRAVLGTLSYDQLAVGSFVCKYGHADLARCGTITSKTFAPSSVPNRTNTWPVTDTQACVGDSGGPVYAGNQAVGVLSGGTTSGSCGNYFYTPHNRLGPNIGVHVLVQ
jgi:hypothetical protein